MSTRAYCGYNKADRHPFKESQWALLGKRWHQTSKKLDDVPHSFNPAARNRFAKAGYLKRVIIHGGVPKTGTTFIQNTLFENRDRLRQHGVLHPHTGLHRLSPEVGYRHLGLTRSIRMEGAASGAFGAFREEFESSGCEVAVISHEGLFAPNVSPLELKGALAGYDAKVILYFRNPIDYIESKYRQWVRRELFSGEIGYFLINHEDYIRFDLMLVVWREVFGKENIVVKSYDHVEQKHHLADAMLKSGGVIMAPLSLPTTSSENAGATNDETFVSLIVNKLHHAGVRVRPEALALAVASPGLGNGRLLSDDQLVQAQEMYLAPYHAMMAEVDPSYAPVAPRWASRPHESGFFDEALRHRITGQVRSAVAEYESGRAAVKQSARQDRAEKAARDAARAARRAAKAERQAIAEAGNKWWKPRRWVRYIKRLMRSVQ